ncbi:hypothetical protein GH714_017674 [Hevea brasiliensis]|uniref:Leucine-rich repeat-containing N-terminal plant-type domain-containing protein n=1 Tax=Hevea brasiliensis TaxID=3981 RepID=A0A6A6N2W0_HEVBR|nr:hypothetical protein GH714_017674 [Hevea brasiliensis]
MVSGPPRRSKKRSPESQDVTVLRRGFMCSTVLAVEDDLPLQSLLLHLQVSCSSLKEVESFRLKEVESLRVKLMEKLSLLLMLLLIIISFNIVGLNAQLVDCLESDREALIDFKNGLVDRGNLLSSWQGSNCCQWWGIGCNNKTGAVIIVDLHNPDIDRESHGLSGKIRPSVTKLKYLEYLDLSFNTFNVNEIPAFFESFEKLQYLNLAYAGFIGTVPPNLGNISALRYLNVSSYPWMLTSDNLEWMKGLISLKYLAMNGVYLSQSDWVGALKMLPNLTFVHLSSCSLNASTSLLSFGNFSSLAYIDLSSNNLYMFPFWLVNISSLISVDLSFNELQGSIPLGFSQLPNLQFLQIHKNYLTGSCHQLFHGSWKKLQVIQLGDNFIHGKLPASIVNLTSLTYLALPNNNIKGEIPSSIGKLCNLKLFDFSLNSLTGSLPEILGGTENCLYRNPFPILQSIQLSYNHLEGKLPNWLGQLENLVELFLDHNFFYGSVPSFRALRHLTTIRLDNNELNGTLQCGLGQLSKLSYLDVSSNHLIGSLPESLGQLSELFFLDVSFNCLSGVVTESHFSKLNNLKVLSLSSNSLIFNLSSNWTPPFQINGLQISSCYLGSFPIWLKSQRGITYLDFSNASISYSIPSWFWDISGSLSFLNFSSNKLQGELPNPLKLPSLISIDLSFNILEGPLPLPVGELLALDLSHNQFSGPIPETIGEHLQSLNFLSLAGNQLIGAIPASIGRLQKLVVIDLSKNNLLGSIPSNLGNCNALEVLDLQNNFLSGMIPNSLGQLKFLCSLHLSNNMLSGKLPPSFQNLSRLEILDLGGNKLEGNIPSWIGYGFKHLRILRLRSNAFLGQLPSILANLSSLQVLDLAENELNGTIPSNLGNLKAMTKSRRINHPLQYLGSLFGKYYEESLVVNMKGQSLIYTKTLSLLTCIDISGNYLHGELPHELTELEGLVVLNLSRNHISGQIPRSISELNQLSSLDLSNNMLSGLIPLNMSLLSSLGYLNLSNNNFSGRIPFVLQLATFEASSFAGVGSVSRSCQSDMISEDYPPYF